MMLEGSSSEVGSSSQRKTITKKEETDFSNCDYISEIFREQMSELEYSKVLADSDNKEEVSHIKYHAPTLGRPNT